MEERIIKVRRKRKSYKVKVEGNVQTVSVKAFMEKMSPVTPTKKGKEVKMSLVSRLCMALMLCQKRLPNKKFAWNPSKEFIELSKGLMELNKYNRPVVPAYGGDNDQEVLPGMPLWLLIDRSGNVNPELAPKGAIEVEDVHKLRALVVDKIREAKKNGTGAPFVAAKKMWEGPSHILDIFGDDGARILAAMGSTNARGAYTTEDTKVYVVDLSNQESIKALIAHDPDAVHKPKRLLKWMGENPNVEVDGMSIASLDAMPGKTKACQMRALAMHTSDRIEMYKKLNQEFSDEILGNINPKMSGIEIMKVYNDAVDNCLENMDEDDIKVRYAKGMLVASKWLGKKVVLLDINAMKGRNKGAIKKHVKEHGFWKANDLVMGLLQDIGTGNISMSWQAIMYIMWQLPANFPTNLSCGTNMSGKFAFNPSQRRAAQKLLKAITAFEQGTVDATMGKIFEHILMDELVKGDKISERLTMALWNNKIVRQEVGKWIMNFLRRCKYLFQTEGMERVNQILPEKRYMLDMNWLPGHESRVPIKLHDGTTHEACVAFLKDDHFWKKMGVDETPVVMFRHPVSDFRVIDVVLLRNPNAFGWKDLSPGLWLNSNVTKIIFTGDTDGDVGAFFPLHCPIEKQDDGSYAADFTKEDYCCLYSVVSKTVKLDMEPTNVEDYLAGVSTNPIPPHLGAAEEIMGQSGQLVGSAALLQSQVYRLLTHYAKGDLEVMDPTPENKKQLELMMSTIVKPLYLEIAAILELSISLQKKNVFGAICEALNKSTFLSDGEKDEEMFFGLIMAIVSGTTNMKFKRAVGDAVAAVQAGEITDFKNNWGSAVCSYMRKLMQDIGVVVRNEDGSRSPIEYAYRDSDSRFADQMRDEDPELCFGLYDNLNWGILRKSNMKDALANWSAYFNRIAHKVKERVLNLTKGDDFNDPTVVTNANRCIGDYKWAYIVPNFKLTMEEKKYLGDMYASKVMWSNLGLKVNWDRKLDANPVNNTENVEYFEYGCESSEASTAFMSWIVARYLSGQQQGVTCPAFIKLIRGLYKESFENFSIKDAKSRASDWITAVRKHMAKHSDNTIAEWTMRHMSKDFRDGFFKSLEGAATLLFYSQGLASGFEIQKIEEFQTAIIRDQELHKDSFKFVCLMQLVNSSWVPSENDFRKVLTCVKYLRGNMKEEVKPWREKTRKLLENCKPELLRQCWRVGYEKGLFLNILHNSWVNKDEIARAVHSTAVQYYFAVWGFDAMRDHGLTKTHIMGDKTKVNPRVPMLINEKFWTSDRNRLKPVAMCESNDKPLKFFVNGQEQLIKRDMHATALVNENEEVVAVICESLIVMRIVLGFDAVSVSKKNFEEKSFKKGSFLPIVNWWSDHMEGNWTRCLVRLRAYNYSLEEVLAQTLCDIDFDRFNDLHTEVESKPAFERVNYKYVIRRK
jgi:hypothetical protein